MKIKNVFVLGSLLAPPVALAIPPVIMSEPVPAISSSYGAGTTHIVVYTITNRVPKRLPITLSGISGSVVRTTVANDCGDSLPPAQDYNPSTCTIGLEITPTAAEIGTTINQTLSVNYQGTKPLQATISFASRQAYLYVANFTGNTISQCPVDLDTGVVSTCSVFNSSLFSGPVAITVNPAGTYAYISNVTNSTVSICSIQANGFLGNCMSSGANGSLNGPSGSKFNNSGSLFYVTNVNSSNLIGVTTCSVNNRSGQLNECMLSGTGLRAPADIALNPSNTLAYITNSTTGINTVSQCIIESNGVLGTCTPSSNIFSGPTGLTLNPEGTLLYVNNRGTNQVSVCSVVSGSPFIGNCTSSNPGNVFTGVNFGKNAISTDTFLFAVNQTANTLVTCSLDGQGELNTCSGSNPGTTFSGPQGIAIN